VTYRFASGRYDQLEALADELKGFGAMLIVAAGGQPSARAALAVTRAIPIVFIIGDDPVQAGLVTSLSHPGGNVTGVSLESSILAAKRMEVLCELVPQARTVGLLINPTAPNAAEHAANVQTAAQTLGRRLIVVRASTPFEIEAAFEELSNHGARGVVVQNDPFFDSRRDQLVRFASEHSLPAMYHIREIPAAGGLVSYGASLADAYRIAGTYAARILAGARPANLPVQQPTKFELVINTRTAKALRLAIPSSILDRADEVIE
jgi:putative ABC transport system substrate-binding protein